MPEHTLWLETVTPLPWMRGKTSDSVVSAAACDDPDDAEWYGGAVVFESCHAPDQEYILAAVAYYEASKAVEHFESLPWYKRLWEWVRP